MAELSNEIKKAVLDNMIAEVEVSIFRVQCTHTAQKKVGAEPQQLEAIVKELTRLEGLKASYQEQIEALNTE